MKMTSILILIYKMIAKQVDFVFNEYKFKIISNFEN